MKITTSCRDCVLAEYDGGDQVDCRLGRLDAFEAAGAAFFGIDDGERRYATIDRYCNACHQPSSPFIKGVPDDKLPGFIRGLVTARVATIILAQPDTTLDDLRATLASLAAMSLGPVRVVVAHDGPDYSAPAAFRALGESGLGVDWQVVSVLPDEDRVKALYGGDRTSRAIDLAVEALDPGRVTYYATLPAGDVADPDAYRRLDVAINDHMLPLVAVTTGSDDVYAALTKFHNHAEVVGNRGERLPRKLAWAREAYPNLLSMDWSELPCE